MADNVLYYGDNLGILRQYLADESVDLVYLDPPFKSGEHYNVLFAEQDGTRSRAQIEAFRDTWRWDEAAAESYHAVVKDGPPPVALAMKAFRDFLGASDMTAYLAMMAPRLVELRRVLKLTGSLYLHCDPTASHYLKMLLDAVFGPENFQREIVWRIGWVSGYKTRARNWIRNHDILLFYVKGPGFTFNKQYLPHPPGYLRRDGKPPKGPGIPLEDVWGIAHEEGLTSIQIMSFSREKLGYPTQKPEALLERIIRASSNEGDLVLDPFCGCGTTVVVAQRLKRQWIGIDLTHLAVTLMKHRLQDNFGKEVKYEVVGEPKDLAGARQLARDDPYQFQWWALGLVGARPVEQKKGADKGVDGRLFFHDGGEKDKTKQITLSVKSGQVSVAHVRDLRGVIEREDAGIGVLISLEKPTKPMRTEAAAAGIYDSPWGQKYPRLQILTVAELLEGKTIAYPPSAHVNITFKKARKRNNPGCHNETFPFEGNADED